MSIYKKEVIDPNVKASKLAKEVCFQSHQNCLALTVVPHQPGNFRGPVGWIWKKHILEMMANHSVDENGAITDWEMLEEAENDGAGGKPMFFSIIGLSGNFAELGWEIVTMCIDDFARSGRFPAIITNDINVKSITDENFYLFETMIEGYGKILKQSNLVNITGEVAIMKFSVSTFSNQNPELDLILNWGASCIGLCHKNKLIDGSKIKPGMPIVGFYDSGYRCNGGTFFVNLIQKNWLYGNKLAFIKKLTIPSKSYAKFINYVHGWNDDGSIRDAIVDIAGIAHITGGGVWEKFGELLPEGVGARLDNMFEPANVLREAQELSWDYDDLRLSDWDAHSTLHGGCGMMVVCKTKQDADTLIKMAPSFNISAKVVGHTITSDDNEILIHSKFKEGKILSSLNPPK